MEVNRMPEFQQLIAPFLTGEFKAGRKCELPIYSYDYSDTKSELTPGHYVDAIKYSRLSLKDVPESARTREFFIRVLNNISYKESEFIKENLGKLFDREFFKDHIASEEYALDSENNCFSYMPLEYIDYEMVCCAIISSINFSFCMRRGDHAEWFYSVVQRKPEVLTQDIWNLAARYYAIFYDSGCELFKVTPFENRTKEYFFALCSNSSRPAMELVPEEFLTEEFIISLLNDSLSNVECFSEAALEKEIEFDGKMQKVWQFVIKNNGDCAAKIPLNQERVGFFFKYYGKDSDEYTFGFKDYYKRWLDTQPPKEEKKTSVENEGLKFRLPVESHYWPPAEFRRLYDSEEYLLEIYRRLGIEILKKRGYFFDVTIPKNISVSGYDGEYVLRIDGRKILETRDVGNAWDREVYVSHIYIKLDGEDGYKF